MEHYRSRMPRNRDFDRKTVGLGLTETEWKQLEGIAREKEWSLAMVVTNIVRLSLKAVTERAAAREVSSDVKAMLAKGIEEANR